MMSAGEFAEFREKLQARMNRDGVGVLQYLMGQTAALGHWNMWARLQAFWLMADPLVIHIRREYREGTPETMSTAEAARQLRCTDRHVRRLLKAGRLRGRICPDGRWAIQRRSLANARRKS